MAISEMPPTADIGPSRKIGVCSITVGSLGRFDCSVPESRGDGVARRRVGGRRRVVAIEPPQRGEDQQARDHYEEEASSVGVVEGHRSVVNRSAVGGHRSVTTPRYVVAERIWVVRSGDVGQHPARIGRSVGGDAADGDIAQVGDELADMGHPRGPILLAALGNRSEVRAVGLNEHRVERAQLSCLLHVGGARERDDAGERQHGAAIRGTGALRLLHR